MSRCTIPATYQAADGAAKLSASVACCRVAGHDGPCHRHAAWLLDGNRTHTTLVRVGPTGVQRLVCSEGAALDGEPA